MIFLFIALVPSIVLRNSLSRAYQGFPRNPIKQAPPDWGIEKKEEPSRMGGGISKTRRFS
jgi:hypothetical protein